MTYSLAEFIERWATVKRSSEALEGLSLADRLALAEADEPGTIGRLLDDLGPEATTRLAYAWSFWARPKQFAPVGDWLIHLHVQGRGGGKTRKAAQWILGRLETGAREIVIVGPSEDDAKQFMVGGYQRLADGGNGSGLLDVLPPWIEYRYLDDDAMVILPKQNATIRIHSAQVPEFRGPNPDTVWCDEIIKWRYPERLLSNLRLACRAVGRVKPQIMITTSPKRMQLLRDLVMEDGVVTYHGRTDENRGNVAEAWFQSERRRLGTTRQAAEELGGELQLDEEGALFPMARVDEGRVDEAPTLDRIVVAVDPAGSQKRTSDDTGIVAAGRTGGVVDGHAYVIADETKRHSWDGWGLAVVQLADKLGASSIVIERNKFADAVSANVRTSGLKIGYEPEARPGSKTLIDLVHKNSRRRIQIVEVLAMGDKATRAGPVSTLYEQVRVHHVGHLTTLETQMGEFDPTATASPGAMDAMVHAMTELFELDRPPSTNFEEGFSGIAEANAKLGGHKTSIEIDSMAFGTCPNGEWEGRII